LNLSEAISTRTRSPLGIVWGKDREANATAQVAF
jgi:hypothetical protein